MSVRHPSFQLCIVALFFALHCVILLQNTKSSSQLNFPPEFSQTVHRNAFLPHVENFCPVKQTLRNHYLNVHYSLYALWHVTTHIPLPPAPTRSQLTATCNAWTQRLHEKLSPCSQLYKAGAQLWAAHLVCYMRVYQLCPQTPEPSSNWRSSPTSAAVTPFCPVEPLMLMLKITFTSTLNSANRFKLLLYD